MARNQVFYATILKCSRIGEIHKGLTLFSASRGLFSCIAHGAWKEKSKLRAATQLFTYGRFLLYFNPVKDSCKVSDVETLEIFEGIREDIHRYYTACLWGEIILKSYGGGESASQLFDLHLTAMRLLEESPGEELSYLMVQFLWRFLSLSGVKPEVGYCHSCGSEVAVRDPLYFHSSEARFICRRCAGSGAEPFYPGMRLYLEKSLALDLSAGLKIRTEKKAVESLKKMTYHILEVLLEFPLKTLRSGGGIL